MIRRTLSALAIAASLVPFSPAIGTAHAEAAPQHTQVPGYYRMALGNLEITALYDGYVDLDAKLLLGASKAEVQRLLARSSWPATRSRPPSTPTSSTPAAS